VANILVVEDDPLFRQSLEHLLTEFGHRAESADSADEAVAKVHYERFELLLCDVRISGAQDGVDALARVREVQPDIRCIVMTGYSDVNVPVRAARLHANDYLLKPFKMQALLDSIRNVLTVEPGRPSLLARLGEVPGKAFRWFYDAQLQTLEQEREAALRQFFILVRSRRLSCREAYAFFCGWEELELAHLHRRSPAKLLAGYRAWSERLVELQPPETGSTAISPAAFERLYERIQSGVLDVPHLLQAVRLLHVPESRRRTLEDFCAYHWLWAPPSATQGDPFLGTVVGGYRLVRQLSGGDSATRVYAAEPESDGGQTGRGDRILCLPSEDAADYVRRETESGRARLLGRAAGNQFLLYPSYAMSLKFRLEPAGLPAAEAWNLLRPVFVQVSNYHARGQVCGCFSLRDIDCPPGQNCALTSWSENRFREVHKALHYGHPDELFAAPEVLHTDTPTAAADQAVLGRLLFELIHGGTYPDPALQAYMRLLGSLDANQAFAPHVQRLGPLSQVFYRLAHGDPSQRYPSVADALSAGDAALRAHQAT
jgi:DNA-binding response OmpR family regulator